MGRPALSFVGLRGSQCVLLLLFLIWSPAVAHDVISIGGFVTVSPKLADAIASQGQSSPDLQAVRIQLYSPGGVKAAEGDCSPNGYYFVPVDAAGSYTARVQGPEGWVFEPQELTVTCDSSSCNNSDDVNFAVAGVELSGHLQTGPVAASCKANSPPAFTGITISMQPMTAGRKDRVITASPVGTTYSMGPLLPGDYVVTASHPHWQLEPASITHTLRLDAPQVTHPFRIKGYTLSGAVSSRSGPVAGIQVTLLSSDDVEVGCSGLHPPGHVSLPNIEAALSTTALCSVTTAADGKYIFPGIPCGQYSLKASHPDTDSVFEIEPSLMTVNVGQGDAAVSEEFVVTGFSVSGRVVDSAGNGVPTASVYVNGKERATTDLTGRYVLPRMQEGKTDISAEKQNYEFSSLSAVSITPSAQVLPDIIVTKVGVCGRLSYGDMHFKKNSKRVTLTALDGSGMNAQATADELNKFCFLVPPGRYRLAPYVSADDKSKGLVVAPTHVDLVVVGEPVLDLQFGQAKLAIHGTVYCLEGPCPDDVMVVVHVASTGTKLLSGKLADIQTSSAPPKDGGRSFTFTGVRPGSYLISATKDGWCWDDSRLPFKVEASDATAPTLKQKGYELQISTNQAVELVILGNTGAAAVPFQFAANKGSSTLCLPSSGTFTVNPRGCYIFSSQSYTVTVGAAATAPTLQLTTSRAYVDGFINVVPNRGSPASDSLLLPASIEIGTITVEPADSVAEAGVVAKATQLNPEAEPGLYSYSLALDMGSTVVVEPVPPDTGLLIFTPQSTRYHLGPVAQGCPQQVPNITAYQGVLVSGSTEPAVAGAKVEVVYASASALTNKAVGDSAGTGVTKSDGSFSIGPLPGDATYTVDVAKAGHVLQQEATQAGAALRFSSKQLAQVTVEVDVPRGTDLSGVFLSLSGSGGFKQNTRLNPDNTHIAFQGLQPGTYYLKPLLREHSFDPPLVELQLTDGQQLGLQLTAVRTAWGVSGSVKSVGSSPLPGAVVEACRADSGVVLDSALTDDQGDYRVGGLKPGNTYLIRVQLDGRVVAAYPAGRKVTLGEADQPEVDFTAFRTSARSAVTASLSHQIAASTRAAVKAELFPASASGVVPGSSPVETVAVDGSGFIELRGVKQGSYVLKLSCAGGLSCSALTVPVQVTTKDLHLGVLPFQGPSGPPSSDAGTAPAGSPTAADDLYSEGLDWKLPVIVLVLFIAASATVLRPAVVDILQLRPVPPPPSADVASLAATSSKASGNGALNTAALRAAVAEAAAVPTPDSDSTLEWTTDADQRSLGVKSKSGSVRSRASRRA